MAYKINENCIGCQSCLKACPAMAISVKDNGQCVIDKTKCMGCGTCAGVCPAGAVESDL